MNSGGLIVLFGWLGSAWTHQDDNQSGPHQADTSRGQYKEDAYLPENTLPFKKSRKDT